jgi:bifunctional non-homologous end joining protein LigD
VHLHRFPEGIDGKDFYQKRPPDSFPDWIQLVDLDGSGQRHILCEDRRTLLYLANLGSIDVHPWLSRAMHPDNPDWAVLDIDAKQSTFGAAVKVVRKAGSLLRGLGLRAFVKTSGGSGLHVFVPLGAAYTYQQSRMFAEAVARLLVMENRESATVERDPRKRGEKVYVDFLQNRRGQTIVPPYSARPVPNACVSMPLDWDELRSDLNPDLFTIQTARTRMKEQGDLFRPVLGMKQDLLAAIDGLGEFLQR